MKTVLRHNDGTIEVIEVDDEAVSEDECRAFAALQDLGPYEFERLTGYPIGSDDLFVFDQNGVRSREYSHHELALLDSGSRSEILETLRHRLDFPCTPTQLINFVDAVSWFFDLPDTFVDFANRNFSGAISDTKREPIEQINCLPAKVRTKKDGLAVAMEAGFRGYKSKHLANPTARALFDWLVDNDDTGKIEDFDQEKDKLTWRRSDGGLSDTVFKSFQGRFTAFMKKQV